MQNATPLSKIAKCFLPFFFFSTLYSENCQFNETERLLDDLETVEYWDSKNCERFQTFSNNLLQIGYINMPSARMQKEGDIAIGGSYVPPYHNWNVRAQILNKVELTFNYRIFKGIPDPVLSKYGFGDFSDKGVNLKCSIVQPEDFNYELPGISVGMDDFLGTRSFKSRYIVATQVFPRQNFEISLGWGEWRIHGFFGGITWIPFGKCNNFLSSLALTAEYDAVPYTDKDKEPHPDGRVKNSDFNFGLKYRLGSYFEFSSSWVRGDAFAFAASFNYNFGETKGFVPKINDPLPFRGLSKKEVIDDSITEEESMIRDVAQAFRSQGFDMLGAWREDRSCKVLRLHVYNNTYRYEYLVKQRISAILAYTILPDFDKVIVCLMSEGFPIQEYHYSVETLQLFANQSICQYELDVLTPLCEVTRPDPYTSQKLFFYNQRSYSFSLIPDLNSYFGSSKGKFKYSVGFNSIIDGFSIYQIYYYFRFNYMFVSDINGMQGIDRLNPSQIINVNTDKPLYLRKKGLTIPSIYLRKVWNMGKGYYSKIAAGWFERGYAGVASEFLYYPVKSRFAFGIEGAVLKKRKHRGLNCTNKIRKLKGFIPSYENFLGTQYFANLYYDFKELNLEVKLKAGQFLAKDFGIRYEFSKYFKSGMRLTFWYTHTNGNDKINRETYYDKGVMISMPLDIFYTCSSRRRWSYGMSAWLRDVGYFSYSGGELYYLINDQRQN